MLPVLVLEVLPVVLLEELLVLDVLLLEVFPVVLLEELLALEVLPVVLLEELLVLDVLPVVLLEVLVLVLLADDFDCVVVGVELLLLQPYTVEIIGIDATAKMAPFAKSRLEIFSLLAISKPHIVKLLSGSFFLLCWLASRGFFAATSKKQKCRYSCGNC